MASLTIAPTNSKSARVCQRTLLIAVLAAIAFGSYAKPTAQIAPTRYTFTRIAEHGFPQFVEGQGVTPQFIDVANSWGPSINDDGVVVFGHAGEFPFNRTVASVGDGTTVRQVHGGGFAAPDTGAMGIDGQGNVYLFTSPPDPLVPSNHQPLHRARRWRRHRVRVHAVDAPRFPRERGTPAAASRPVAPRVLRRHAGRCRVSH